MTVRQFLEISQLDRSSFAGLINYQVELVSIYLDIDPFEVIKMKKSEFLSSIKKIESELKNLTWKENIAIGDANFKVKPFDQLTLGEFIDLESYLSNKKITNILSIVYRRYNEPNFEKIIFEDYDKIDIQQRSRLFENLEASEVIGILPEIRKFRDKIINSYTEIFQRDDSEEIDDPKSIEESKLVEAKKFHEQYAWESLILYLANDDITKFNDVVNLPVILAFNIATYRKGVDKRREQDEQSKWNSQRMRR